jgi:hypothetical protein
MHLLLRLLLLPLPFFFFNLLTSVLGPSRAHKLWLRANLIIKPTLTEPSDGQTDVDRKDFGISEAENWSEPISRDQNPAPQLRTDREPDVRSARPIPQLLTVEEAL